LFKGGEERSQRGEGRICEKEKTVNKEEKGISLIGDLDLYTNYSQRTLQSK